MITATIIVYIVLGLVIAVRKAITDPETGNDLVSAVIFLLIAGYWMPYYGFKFISYLLSSIPE